MNYSSQRVILIPQLLESGCGCIFCPSEDCHALLKLNGVISIAVVFHPEIVEFVGVIGEVDPQVFYLVLKL